MFDKNKVCVFNFSGIYETQSFYKKCDGIWIDMKETEGTNCYCDENAANVIRKKIKDLPLSGIHFLDSGNYHYMSRFWLEKIEEPFELIVFDHHTDMQLPIFQGLLSCGGWIYDSILQIPQLKKVWILGPSQADFEQVDEKIRNKAEILTEEEMKHPGSIRDFLGKISQNTKLYLSVDKDVFSEEEVKCNWSQGQLSVKCFLKESKDFLETYNSQILGVDVCGEREAGIEFELPKDSDEVNNILLTLFTK